MKLNIYTIVREDDDCNGTAELFTDKVKRDRAVIEWLLGDNPDEAKVDRLYKLWLEFDNCDAMPPEMEDMRDVRSANLDFIYVEDHEIEIHLTPEQIHDQCHDLEKTVSAEEFCAGCIAYQKRLFGRSPTEEEQQKLKAIAEILEEYEDTGEPLQGPLARIDAALQGIAYCPVCEHTEDECECNCTECGKLIGDDEEEHDGLCSGCRPKGD